MKKILILLSVIIIGCSPSISFRKQITDWKKEHLKGKVKSVEVFIVDFHNNAQKAITENETKRLSKKYLYNQEGYKVEEFDYYEDSKYFKWLYEIEKNGNPIKIEKHHCSYETFMFATFEYDKNGNQISRKEFDEKHNPYKTIVFKYDKNNMAERLFYDENFTIYTKYTMEYDDENRIIEEKYYIKEPPKKNRDLVLNSIHRYVYLPDNSYILEETKSSFTSRSKYNHNNQIVEKQYCFSHNNCQKELYQYDDYKNLILKTSFKNDTLYEKKESIYTYDLNGNWIREDFYVNGIKEGIIERRIQYY